ncbi:MAG: universal stress protein [Allosphingosinicella sp.]|uniref:universal stress protein n=1 Tax=Allosphingosinicella sp. TaxID=2823234 RepID=UPI00392D2529
MKSVLLHIHDDLGQEARLQAALDIVRCFDGHLTCLQATPFDSYIVSDPFGGVYAFPEVIRRVREDQEAARSRIEADLANEGVSWDWLHFDGAASQMLVDQARLADVIVVSQPGRDGGERQPLPIAADIAIHSRAPVLAIPQASRRLDCAGTAMIAWNGSAEAAYALRVARPMLRGAAAIHIVEVTEGGDDLPSAAACRYLARHGMASELHERPRGDRSIPELLSAAAAELQADYVVMGAYGRSRLRELVLGGVTRDMLHDSTVPILMAH